MGTRIGGFGSLVKLAFGSVPGLPIGSVRVVMLFGEHSKPDKLPWLLQARLRPSASKAVHPPPSALLRKLAHLGTLRSACKRAQRAAGAKLGALKACPKLRAKCGPGPALAALLTT